jgi:glycosyltransferase involved in cell wall biosynthesis
MKLHYAGIEGEGFGWGRCNHYLKRELGKLTELVDGDADVCFMPIADHDLRPFSPARGKVTVGYTFFEYPLGNDATKNAQQYDWIFCGSTWCKDRLAELGIRNTQVLIQGVDHDIFKPDLSIARDDGEFRIFSGGKFEWRKGQDLVLAAFKMLHKAHPDMRLVVSWHNLWPQLYETMRQSPWIKCPDRWADNWSVNLSRLCELNDIPKDKVYEAPPVPQIGMAFLMNQTDCAVFPNRCEGGTNLVLMEYAACGKPVVANAGTGQADVRRAIFNTIYGCEGFNHWFASSPGDVAAAIEYAHCELTPVSPSTDWTWYESASQVVNACKSLLTGAT